MEQQPHNPEDDRWHNLADEEPLIYLGITDALREDRAIDHATARLIAAHLHMGQLPTLRAFASSGTVGGDMQAELEQLRNEAPIDVEPWLDALDEYLLVRSDPRPVARWHDLWPTPLLAQPPVEQVGDVDEMGWFALFHYEDRPGGFICVHDMLGLRTYVATHSNDELSERWMCIRDEYAYYYRAHSRLNDEA
jgi:hypothetical protein